MEPPCYLRDGVDEAVNIHELVEQLIEATAVDGDPEVGAVVMENCDVRRDWPTRFLEEQLDIETACFEGIRQAVPSHYVLEANEVGGERRDDLGGEREDRKWREVRVPPDAVCSYTP